ncbi:MAG: plasmid partition protein ParG [Pirellulaceae bacterium]
MSKKVSISPRPKLKPQIDEWVENRIDPEEERPRVKPKRLTIDIEPELHTQLKIYCAKNGCQIADVLRPLIAQKVHQSEH